MGPAASGPATSPRTSANPTAEAVSAVTTVQADVIGWMHLSLERAEEVAVELRQFGVAIGNARKRLVFDSEPSNWDTTFARWHEEPG